MESTHVKLPRVGIDGNVHLRWFAVVAHIMPLFVYRYLFDPAAIHLIVPREYKQLEEHENLPTPELCETDWCQKIRGYSIMDISNCLGKLTTLWLTKSGGATALPDESTAENLEPGSSYNERAAICFARVKWDNLRNMLFPLSLNALGEEVDALNTHEDPTNALVYPSLLTNQALSHLAVFSTRPKAEAPLFKGGPFDQSSFELRKKLKNANKSSCEFPPENGGIEMEFGEGTRFPFLNEQKIESLSLLSLFRELYNRAGELNNDALKKVIRVKWFQMSEQAYIRRRQAHTDAQPEDPNLTERDRFALFDAVSGASLVLE